MEQGMLDGSVPQDSTALIMQRELEQRITDALKRGFKDITVELERMPGGRYTGKLVWDGFQEDDFIDRQRRVRHVLREQLNEESKEVGVLFTYTTNEIRAMQEA